MIQKYTVDLRWFRDDENSWKSKFRSRAVWVRSVRVHNGVKKENLICKRKITFR